MKGGGYQVETWVEAAVALNTGIMFTRGVGDTVIICVGPFVVSGSTLHVALDHLRQKLEAACST